MSLYRRLQDAQGSSTAVPGGRNPVLDELRQKIHHQLIDELGAVLYDKRVSEDDLRTKVSDSLQAALARETAPISGADRLQLLEDVADDILGYGPIDRHLHDESVTEVMVNGPRRVFVERNGRIEVTNTTFIDESHLRRIIDKIVGQVGRRIDEATPMVDARLPDGSRVNAVVHPLAIGGPFLTVRKFAAEPFSVEDLVGFGTFSEPVADFLEGCVRGRMNIVVSGGTGTGKTTTLNVLSSFIPSDERIVTVEDAKELQLHQVHVLPLEGRPPNIEGRGEVTIRDLVRNALRMRPDRIVVGECRVGRGARHAPGHEHRPRRIPHHHPRQQSSRCAGPHRDHDVDGRIRVARSGHPRADGVGPRRDRAPVPSAATAPGGSRMSPRCSACATTSF